MIWTLVWLAPGGTLDSEFVCSYVTVSYFRLVVKWSKLTQLLLKNID